MDSILNSVKKMLGLDESYEVFDPEIIIYINNALMVLEQLGVGHDGFTISSDSETWSMFLIDPSRLDGAKTYTYIRTRLLFDPPANATLTNTLESTARELEWRLNVKAEQIAAEENT